LEGWGVGLTFFFFSFLISLCIHVKNYVVIE